MASYDNGEVIQDLDRDWEFLGANAFEWICGFLAFMLISSFGASPVRVMPLMLTGAVITTTTLAALRRTYPDQQRGLRNVILSGCGFVPPGIPAPASLQPVWSGCPVRELNPRSKFVRLGLDQLFPSFQRDLSPAEMPLGDRR